jgi:hypothetical protein
MDGRMTNIFVSSDETKVIGGTANVNVEVDFGPQGDRGNLFLVGYGDPNTISHSVTLQLLDFYINVQATDEDYMVLYQYVNSSGTNTWVPTGTLMTDKFSVIRQVLFELNSLFCFISFGLFYERPGKFCNNSKRSNSLNLFYF